MFSEDDLLPISALQHLLFCERQCALIHVERLWRDNVLTVEGSQLHHRADEAGPRREVRGDIVILRGVALRSRRLGLTGRADIMEEFRAFAADRLVLSLINRQQVKPSGFELRETGGVYMDEATRKTVLVAYQERKQEALRYPFLDEKVTNGALFHVQALLLARHLRGDIDAYPAFIWK